MNKNLLKTLSVITAFAYSALFLAVFIHGVHMMNMKGMMADCPFMQNIHVVCNMNGRDHLQLVSGIDPEKGREFLVLLTFTIGVLTAYLFSFKVSSSVKTKSFLFLKNQKYRFNFSLFTEKRYKCR